MSNTNSPQYEKIINFIKRLPQGEAKGHLAGEESDEEMGQPEVIFRSPLELTQEQEEALVTHCLAKKDKMISEQGREMIKDFEWYRSSVDLTREASRTFMGKRQLYENVYHLQLEWREFAYGEDSLYADSNLHLPLTRRICQQQSARANDYFFSTDPWFGAVPQGTADVDLANEVERFTRYKVKKAKAKHVLKKAVRGAFIRGEAVTKVTHKEDVSYFRSVSEVAIDPATNEPFTAKDGDYIYQTDNWVLAPVMITDPETGQPVQGEQMVLKRDNSTPHPTGGTEPLVFEYRNVRRSITRFKGAEIANVYFKDILIPIEAENLQDADVICQIYDRPAVEFAQMYMSRVQARGGEFGDELPRVIEMLQSAGAGTWENQPYASQPRPQLGEEEDVGAHPKEEPVIETGEFYAWFDADDDGILENVMVVIDLNSKKPIYYDYVENVTPDGLRPFQVHRVNPVDGRWYGTGTVETLWPLQESMDLMWNRMNFSQSRSGNVIFWNPDSVVEGDQEDNLQINGGETLQLKPGREAKDALQIIPLYDIKFDKLREMVEMITQFGIQLSGVSGPNDAAMANLQTQERATGIVANEKLGQELFSDYIGDLEEGVECATQCLIMNELHFMDDAEMYEFFENDVRALAVIEKHRVHNMDIDVSIDLNRFKGEQTISRLQAAIEQGIAYYNLHPMIQEKLATMFRQTMKHLGIKDVNEVIEPLMAMMPAEEVEGEGETDSPVMPMSPPPTADLNQLAQAAAPAPSGPEPNLPSKGAFS